MSNVNNAVPAYGKVLTGILYGDTENVHNVLSDMRRSLDDGSFDKNEAVKKLDGVISDLGCFSRYPEYKDSLSCEKDGIKYGAYTEEGEPCIGGGVGYKKIYTTGDYVVRTTSELKEALEKAESGQTVYVDGDAVIDVSSVVESKAPLVINGGVTLASDRGRILENGKLALGGMITILSIDVRVVFRVCDGAVISGIRFKGPDPERHVSHHTRSFYTGKQEPHKYYYLMPALLMTGMSVTGSNVEVANCEITGFGCSAIGLGTESKNNYIHHNYIHHNQGKGLGYGVSHGRGAASVVEYNLFNFNRHDVADCGAPVTGYTAHHNITMGDCLDHVYDMHGGRDRKDGTNIAGTYCDIYNNTLLSEQSPYHVRGVPEEYHRFHHNIVYGKRDRYPYIAGEKYEIYENIFGIDEMEVLK